MRAVSLLMLVIAVGRECRVMGERMRWGTHLMPRARQPQLVMLRP